MSYPRKKPYIHEKVVFVAEDYRISTRRNKSSANHNSVSYISCPHQFLFDSEFLPLTSKYPSKLKFQLLQRANLNQRRLINKYAVCQTAFDYQ